MTDQTTTLRRAFIAERVGSMLMDCDDGRQLIELVTLPEDSEEESLPAAIAAALGDGHSERVTVEINARAGAIYLVLDAPAGDGAA